MVAIRRSYDALVDARTRCVACPSLTNPSAVDGGVFDSDRIGPYTRWEGRLDSPLVVIAQDFSDLDTFRRLEDWPGAGVPTNLALVELLAAAGIAISPPRTGTPDDVVFFTNAVLCLKAGTMNSRVSPSCFRACAHRFLKPLIDLLYPRVVVTLGSSALYAIRHAYGLVQRPSLRSLLASRTSFVLPSGIKVFPLCHPSPVVQRTFRGMAEQRADWARVSHALHEV